MNKKNILIFPAGAENALEIHDALRYNVNVELFGASGKKDYAEFLYDAAHYIEADLYISRSDFLETFCNLLRQYRIDAVIPTHDDIALFLAKHAADLPCKVLVSDYETALVCRRKQLTFARFQKEDFCPKLYADPKAIPDEAFPLFIKPDCSQGGVGAALIPDKSLLPDSLDGYVLSEYLPGREYTVDCFTKSGGALVFVGARTRDRICMGIAFRSTEVETTPEIREIAETINASLRFFGAWYFQLREDAQGKLKLLEISCRQAGTMTLYRHLGVNFPMLGIFELFGVDTSFVPLPAACQIERRLHTAFHTDISFTTVYMDYDDTLVLKQGINLVALTFLYSRAEKGNRLILLTRHEGGLAADLKRRRISPDLFDEIIELTFAQDKCDYIDPQGAIFIDNSFAEREKVWDRFHIPVFDVDMIDMLNTEGD